MSAKRDISSLLGDDWHSQPPTKIPRLHSPSPSKFQSYQLSYITPSSVPTPPFQQPLPLLTFSYTPTRTLEFTDSALRYFVEPSRGADLNYGVERWIRRPEERGRIDGLLKAWGRVRSQGRIGEVGVVTWRGVMTK
jgi:RAT1-interacting protein